MSWTSKLLRVTIVSAALTALCVLGASAETLGVGTVTADALRLRSEPSTESSILATAAQGEIALILEETEDGWYRVDYHTVEGYMSAEYIEFSAQAEVDLGYGMVQVDGATLNVRTGPGTDHDIVTILWDRAVVTLTGIDSGWYSISYQGKTGYVSSEYVVTCDNSGNRGDKLPAATLGQQIVDYAKQFLGVPYVWGGNGPYSFDCSGFTKYVYAHFGYTLNRNASSQLYNGYSVSRSELQPGDLVFFDNGKVSTPVSHVGIYIGGGQFIHASTNNYAVEISDLSGYYGRVYVYARRII